MPSTEKETGFFFDDDVFFKGRKEYARFFPKSARASRYFTVDATPEYLYYPSVPARLNSFFPNAKFVVVVRNPVERALSAYNMLKNNVFIDKYKYLLKEGFKTGGKQTDLSSLIDQEGQLISFQAAIEREMEEIGDQYAPIEPSFLRRGIYVDQIKRWFQYFKPTQFKFIVFEEFKSDPSACLHDLSSFLGLPQFDWSSVDFPVQNAYDYQDPIDPELEVQLYDFYKPHNEALTDLLGLEIHWERKEP